ncbi:hypothetical protein AVEN_246455-1, partial [Araneus ventricosus]
PEMVSL